MSLKRFDPVRQIAWPEGVRLTIAITFDFEAEEDAHFRQTSEVPVDWREYGEREYDGRQGVWRALRVLAKHDVKATFFACGATLENYSNAAKAIVEGGHELGGHAYHHEYFDKLSALEEVEALNRMMVAFETVVGRKPDSFRSCSPSHRTLANLIELGMRLDSTNLDHDLPYIIEREDGRRLLEIPNGFGGDIAQYGHPVGRHLSSGRQGIPAMALDSWKRDFDFAYERGADRTEMMVITLHPYSTGRPSRARAFDRFLAYVQSHPDVWFARMGDIADWWLSRLENPTAGEARK